ncbi:sterol desaturase family protein [Pontibacter sp. H249]|uniref:sterol desaturase family protein n=1 Tax=Pontibacter sp. H249 TaxID=3133420 RepID=UPI0030C55DA2
MEKEIFTFDHLEKLDEHNIMPYAIPLIIICLVVEWGLGMYRKRNYYEKKDFLAALGIGAGNAIIGGALKIVVFTISMVIYNEVPWAIPRVWWGFIVCFIAVDFCRYWAHRISHEQRLWWATHVTHHSSEKMNFAISFRTSWTTPIKFLFFLPVPFLGFDPLTFFICHQLAVLYQFWVHTEIIKKMPAPFEYFFVTPSHHRVHHGSDVKYLDKNYGSTFIIWDRMFGTFQKEEEHPTYGLTTPVKSYNPVYLVFHEWVDIWHDLKHAKSPKEVWAILFKPPGAVVTEHQRSKLGQPEQVLVAEKAEKIEVEQVKAAGAA